MRQLYLSTYHVGPHTANDVRAIERHTLRYLLGYPSSLHSLAVACRAQGIAPRGVKVVIGNAEPVLDHQREVIEEVFGCPVRETYGMAEFVAAASECDAGRMHLWPEVGIVEVLAPGLDRSVPDGTAGRLVATSLLNATMPLLRYEIGDHGALAIHEPCPCGRTLPVIERIEGRVDDLVTTTDGRVLGRLDPVFKGGLAIAAAQIVQEDLGAFRVLVVPASGYDASVGETIARRLLDRVGSAEVVVEEVEAIPTGANGKFKAFVSRSRLPDEPGPEVGPRPPDLGPSRPFGDGATPRGERGRPIGVGHQVGDGIGEPFRALVGRSRALRPSVRRSGSPPTSVETTTGPTLQLDDRDRALSSRSWC